VRTGVGVSSRSVTHCGPTDMCCLLHSIQCCLCRPRSIPCLHGCKGCQAVTSLKFTTFVIPAIQAPTATTDRVKNIRRSFRDEYLCLSAHPVCHRLILFATIMSDNQNSFATIMPDNDSTPDMSDNGSMRSWAELPPLPLSLVFSYLGLAERAGMARVSSSWAKATAAATTTIELANCSNTRQPAAVAAQQHGGLAGGDNQDVSGVISSLPWPGLPRLQNVTVAHSSVDLRPGSQLLQDLSAATTLTRLELQVVTFQGEPDLAALLLALPNLLHLSFVYLNKVQASSQPLASPAQRSHAGLTSLWSGSSGQGDSCECFSDEGMQLLCSLTQLKALCLHSMRDVTAAGLVGLQSLQGLEVLVLGDLTCEISLSTVPAFSQLSALTHLNLKWVEDTAQGEFDPSVLAYMTQFKDLNLWDWTPSNGAAGAAELLSWLALMPLERLILAGVDSLEQCPPELISNLSASSVLRTLGCWGLG